MSVAAIVIENLLYVVGAAVGILVGALVVTLRHRRPTSVEANVTSFHRGLAALAPDRSPGSSARRRVPAPPTRASPVRSVHVVGPARPSTPIETEAETV